MECAGATILPEVRKFAPFASASESKHSHAEPMSGKKGAQFGQVQPSAIPTAATSNPPSSVLGKRGRDDAVPLLKDIDVESLEMYPPEKRTNDRVGKICFPGGKRFMFDVEVLPQFSRMPFAPSFPTKDGVKLSEIMGTRLDLTPEQEEKYLAIEKRWNDMMRPHRVEAYPHDPKKKGAEGKPITPEVFDSKAKSQVTGADPDKGYAASLKVRVLHEEGKQPKIEKVKVIEDPVTGAVTGVTFPKPGNIGDLLAKCAVAARVSIRGGGFFGNFGHGLPLTLEAAVVVTNKQESTGPTNNYQGVNFVQDPDEDNEPPQQFNGSELGMHADDEEEAYTDEQMQADMAASANGGGA